MDNLIFCLNVTVPIFLTLLLGYFFRRIGLFDEAFVNRMNKFVFVIPLPVLLFQDIAKIDIYEAWDPQMVLFCFAITSLSIMISCPIFSILPISGASLSRHPTAAARRSLVSPLSRTFTEMQVWHH